MYYVVASDNWGCFSAIYENEKDKKKTQNHFCF